RGDWRGVIGAQHSDRDFSALGDEAFVPPSDTSLSGLFFLQELQFDNWRLDGGLRIEDVDTRAADGRSAGHQPFSVSVGALWHFDESSHISLNLASAERAPGDQELFSDGPHVANQSFEIGDATLGEETSRSIELSYRRHAGRLTGSVTIYQNDFDDYIFLGDTGLEEDGFPVRQWQQQDADFTGAEIELRYDIGDTALGHWQWNAFADVVRADFDNGNNVPRIPPRRIGMGLEWDRGCWAGSVDWIHASRQSRTAAFESSTDGYDQLDLNLSCQLAETNNGAWTVFLKGHNLLDEDIRNHTSFLKDQAPMIGRNFTVGARVAW
ncbi:MAG: TonB-dependent receptor, partial [Xanthomonadales bacterium]|nr:TonB-dependent receptor [Xanthomonadales bacterium]